MNTKHTPGPWDIAGPYSKGGYMDFGYLIVVPGQNGYDPDPLHGPREGFTKEDAELIARAPDLLAENERLKAWQDELRDTNTRLVDQIATLRAALKELVEAGEAFNYAVDGWPISDLKSAWMRIKRALDRAKEELK